MPRKRQGYCSLDMASAPLPGLLLFRGYVMTYSEKLKDPRWQKKRLEILDEAGFECENCGNTEKTLHVHHKFYERNKNPWDYDTIDLSVFCTDCHKAWHIAKVELDKAIGDIVDADSLDRIRGYVVAVGCGDIFSNQINDNNSTIGMADYFRTTVGSIKLLIKDSLKGCPMSIPFALYKQSIG